jgi:thiamin-phosphate kinase
VANILSGRKAVSEMNRYDFSAGKLDARLLREILPTLPLDDRTIVGPRVGEDAAVIDMGDRYLVAATDPITFATDLIGWYAVQVNANDVATMGATPKWFLATLLLPDGKTDEQLVRGIFAQIADACRRLSVAFIGGHTEITLGLSRPIVVGTMLGEVAKDRLVTSAGAQVGDLVLVTKGVPLEGCAIIAREKTDELRRLGVPESVILKAQRFLFEPSISVVRDALTACQAAPIHAMHDPTEGGLATGLWELAEASGVVLEVWEEALPILPEATQLCGAFGLNPLGVIASGALLLCVAEREAEKVMQALSDAGISVTAIGKVVARNAPKVLLRQRDGETVPMPLFVKDELTRLP